MKKPDSSSAHFATSVVPWVLLGTLSVLFSLEWKMRRSEAEGMQSALRAHQQGLEGRLDEAKDRLLSLINPLKLSVHGLQSDLAKVLECLPSLEPQTRAGVESAEPQPDSPSVGDPFTELRFSDEALPELPAELAGTQSTSMVKSLDLKTFFQDTRFNPGAKELAPVERLKAIEALATGQAWMEVLNRRIQVDMAVEMEILREERNYVEYDDGESRDPGPPGAITVGESAGDHRIRIFYFDPVTFPELAEKKREIEKVAEKTIRRLLQLAAN